jgi:hypothetical protein
MRGRRNAYRLFVGESKGNLKETGVVEVVADLKGLRTWTSGGLLRTR